MVVGVWLARSVCLVFLTNLLSLSAHAVQAHVEIGREGNILMRRNGEDAHVSQRDMAIASNMKASDDKPMRGQVAVEAKEAFNSPDKIDDSALALWSPRMPGFIEKYPEFYGLLFACSGLAVLGYVWFHIYREDLKAEEQRQRIAVANARKMVAKAASYNRQCAAAFAPPSTKDTDTDTQDKTTRSRPIVAAPKAVTAAVRGKAYASPGENMRLPKFAATCLQDSTSKAENGAHGASTLPGENMRLPKFVVSQSQASTSASGSASPRFVPSVVAETPQFSTVRSGTILMARTAACIFASKSGLHRIGQLNAGEQVLAAGPPEMLDDYTIVPIKPKGAVDMKTMEVVRG